MHRRSPSSSRKREKQTGPRNSRGKNRRRLQITKYDYRDECGELLFQVVRREPGLGGASKSFHHRRMTESGWKLGLADARLTPYRLPQLLAAPEKDWVFIVEGEKDADRLASLGLTATCSVGGAGSWRNEYKPFFHRRRIVILPDNDEDGRRHAGQVARSVSSVAKRVKIVPLPCTAAKGDVSDWLDQGGAKSALLRLASEARRWRPSDASHERRDD